ncbi:hypothetical protein NX722_18820 [Endozoicomonas gorgoniicola]|uniref:Uncharacterized protein n=1 Tax=Endozoicomonas gorgoniicola TaxID=1234144 RepID=A0ABT3MZ41_9GAMM|nr:hypothetical protein [Endozoicomonas gorgoniicola]MCW7554634.1 hypothetical protein [Endozoicomonas gorgoniicola]
MLTLEQVLNFRSQLFIIESGCPNMIINGARTLYRTAPKQYLCELCRSGETYYLRRTCDDKILHVTRPEVFIFVVLPSYPTKVFCVQQIIQRTIDEVNTMDYSPELLMGHTSITRNSPVLYAGQVVLENDSMFAWDNNSGHYRPDSFLHEINFLPPVKHLLPADKMVDYEDTGGAAYVYLEATGQINEPWVDRPIVRVPGR